MKETKELLQGINELGLVLIERFIDGVQFNDFAKLYDKLVNDEEFKSIIEKAYKDASKIPSEIENISLQGGLDLITLQLEYIPKIIESLKKNKIEKK